MGQCSVTEPYQTSLGTCSGGAKPECNVALSHRDVSYAWIPSRHSHHPSTELSTVLPLDPHKYAKFWICIFKRELSSVSFYSLTKPSRIDTPLSLVSSLKHRACHGQVNRLLMMKSFVRATINHFGIAVRSVVAIYALFSTDWCFNPF